MSSFRDQALLLLYILSSTVWSTTTLNLLRAIPEKKCLLGAERHRFKIVLVGGKTAFEIRWLGCQQRKGMYWGGGLQWFFRWVYSPFRLWIAHFCILIGRFVSVNRISLCFIGIFVSFVSFPFHIFRSAITFYGSLTKKMTKRAL